MEKGTTPKFFKILRIIIYALAAAIGGGVVANHQQQPTHVPGDAGYIAVAVSVMGAVS